MLFILILFAIIILSIAIGSQLNLQENFKTSTESSVEEGASGIYKWGYQPIPDEVKDSPSPPYCPPGPPLPPGPCPQCGYNITEIIINETSRDGCSNCDITKHPDINKYVLKSSIPPCPDMSRYVLKSEMCPCTNMNEYIKKSEIPPCGKNGSNSGRFVFRNEEHERRFRNDPSVQSNMEDHMSGENWFDQRMAKMAAGKVAGKAGDLEGVKAYNQIGMIV